MPRDGVLLYQLSEWIERVSKHLNNLSRPQAKILAMYSLGMVLVSRSGRTSVAAVLSELLGKKETSIESQLRDWYCDAKDKVGYDPQRQCGRDEIDIESCFAPWLRWLLEHWRDGLLPIALDATTLRDTFTVLSVSVVYRGNAIPVAWKILPGNEPHAWEPEWENMLELLKPAISEQMLVLVLTDRGLYSPSLFRKIQSLHWHPFMRIKQDGTFRPLGRFAFRPLASFAARPGEAWFGEGTAFKKPENQLQATLLAFWDQNAKEPWLILTDLPPDVAQACWYALRSWIEQSFRAIKRACLLWHHSKMTDPHRAERLWLVIALSIFWFISVGNSCDEIKITTEQPAQLPPTGIPVAQTLHQQQPLPAQPKRRLSVPRRGWFHTLVSWVSQRVVQFADFVLGPLPEIISIFNAHIGET